MQLYPAILTDSLVTCAEQLAVVQTAPEIKTVHIDVIDGLFVENVTLTPADLVLTDPGEFTYDLHLMTDDPLDFVFEAVGLKELLPVRAVVAQVEHMSHQAAFLEEVRQQGWLRGLALDLHTPLEAIDEVSWLDLDIIHLMSIELGQQGRPFSASVLEKIKEVREKCADLDQPPKIIIDGGINQKTLQLLANQGVSGVCVGSGIWTATDPVESLQQFWQQAEALT